MLGIRNTNFALHRIQRDLGILKECHSVFGFCIFISIFIQQILIYWVLIRFQELLYINGNIPTMLQSRSGISLTYGSYLSRQLNFVWPREKVSRNEITAGL